MGVSTVVGVESVRVYIDNRLQCGSISIVHRVLVLCVFFNLCECMCGADDYYKRPKLSLSFTKLEG